MNKNVKKAAIAGGIIAAGYFAKKVYDFVKIRPSLDSLMVNESEKPATIFNLKDALKDSKRPKVLGNKKNDISLVQASLLEEGINSDKNGTFN